VASDTDTQSPEETLRTKRHCMDGSNLVEKVAGCGVDWTGGRMGILDDDVAWLRYGWKEFRG